MEVKEIRQKLKDLCLTRHNYRKQYKGKKMTPYSLEFGYNNKVVDDMINNYVNEIKNFGRAPKPIITINTFDMDCLINKLSTGSEYKTISYSVPFLAEKTIKEE
jgi:hypothetical protein